MESLKLDPAEEKTAQFRKHWWTLAIEIGFIILLAIAPLFLLGFFYSNFILTLKMGLLTIMLYIIWLSAIWILGFIIWMNYYLDVWILTNKRLIDVNQKKLFHRDIATLRLENIQDIKIEISGIINTFLKIGNIHVQTAAGSNEFTMYGIKNPEIAKEAINRAHQEEMEKAKIVRFETSPTPSELP